MRPWIDTRCPRQLFTWVRDHPALHPDSPAATTLLVSEQATEKSVQLNTRTSSKTLAEHKSSVKR